MSDDSIDAGDFMRAMDNAPFDIKKCPDCGGNGLTPVGCCSGFECGCMGLVTDYELCGCGNSTPTDTQLRSWLKTSDNK